MLQNILDQLEALPEWQKYGAVSVLCLLIIGGYYYFSYSPNYDEIEKLDGRILELDNKIKSGMQMKDRERELEREVSKLDEQLKVALEILPDEEEIAEFIKKIESIAVDAGLSVSKFLPKNSSVEKGFKGVKPVELGIRGTFHSVGKFFEKLANDQRIVNMSGFNLNEVQGEKGKYTLTGDITLKAFFFKKAK